MENVVFLNPQNPFMLSKSTDTYQLHFYESFVIAEAKENAIINSRESEQVLKLMLNHFKGRSFTIISKRTNNYTISEGAYSPKIFNKIKGVAVVSSDPAVKERAYEEQLLFRNSFAFFENLDDAIDWAKNFRQSK